jgi:hypothetical protein
VTQAAAAPGPAPPLRSLLAEALAMLAGAVLLAAAVMADPAWFDRHFVRAFFIPRPLFLGFETAIRASLAIAGAALALVLRPRLGRLAVRPAAELAWGSLRIVIAVVLALWLGELGLSAAFSRAAEQGGPTQEPLRRTEPRLGWVFESSHASRVMQAGRLVDYAFDAHGYRAPSLAQPVDPARPSVLFAGESILAGYGLPWSQTIPARVGAALRLQSANLSVFGYADDQTSMRLAAELPRFAHPVAVVILFAPGLFFRDLDDDRPHLGPGLVWRPAVERWRIESLSRLFMAYRRQDEIEDAAARVRAELQRDVALARARGAQPLVVVPRFDLADPAEQRLREIVLDQAGVPYVEVHLDPAWRLPGDLHPNEKGAQAIAQTIVSRLTPPLS